MPPHRSTKELCLYLEENLISSFFPLLHQGFGVKFKTGCSVKSFLCEELGLAPEYVEHRIQTLFLDGKPVDDVSSAIIRDGSTLALSAALPGLAGRVLRKGGRFASMRSTISHREKAASACLQDGTVSLKVFNILLQEIGPPLLKKGVWIHGKDLQDFMKKRPDDFWARCKKAQLDGEEVDLKELSGVKWTASEVLLKLRTH